MRYKDFEVKIRALGDGYEAEVLIAPYPGGRSPFRPPYTGEQAHNLFVALGQRLWASGPDRDLPSARERSHLPPITPEEIGRTLFGSLFAESIGQAFDRSLAHVQARPGRGLRLWLHFDPEEQRLVPIASLPWELLHRDETGDFLCRLPSTPLLRYLPMPHPRRPKLDPPLRVLVVSSAPSDLRPLALLEEWEGIQKAFEGQASFTAEVMECPSLEKLHKKLRRGGWHVLHFMGHGSFESEHGEGVLFLEDPDHRSRPATGTMFAEHLKGISDLRLVVLNACSTGALPFRQGQTPFASIAPALLRAGAPAVLAMQLPISDPAAIAFSDSFYESLAADDPVETAVAEGRLAMYRLNEKSPEWATPALFLGVRDGKILKFRKAPPGAAPPRRTAPSEKPYRIGIRSFAGPGSWGREEVDRELRLDACFDGRDIRQPEFWQTRVFPELRDFLLEAAAERSPLIIDFAAHASIAFAAGYCLNAKSGLDVTIGQRILGSRAEWRVVNAASSETPLWCGEPDRAGDPESRDVALAAGITRPVLDDVELYLRQSGLGVHRILPATISPEPSPTVVRDGLHALQLAQGLNSKVQKRTVHEREGWLHLFASAPNAVLFFLGQLSRGYGRIQLYEHDFDTNRPGGYSPSIQLPATEHLQRQEHE